MLKTSIESSNSMAGPLDFPNSFEGLYVVVYVCEGAGRVY